MPTFSDGFRPAASTSIDAVEKRLGVIFPEDYRCFLLETIGGIPDPNCFTVPDRGDALVGILYGVRLDRTAGDLEYEQHEVSCNNSLPEGMIAIGHDPGGNLLLMQTGASTGGHILFGIEWVFGGTWMVRIPLRLLAPFRNS
jgi:hypothetical protein